MESREGESLPIGSAVFGRLPIPQYIIPHPWEALIAWVINRAQSVEGFIMEDSRKPRRKVVIDECDQNTL